MYLYNAHNKKAENRIKDDSQRCRSVDESHIMLSGAHIGTTWGVSAWCMTSLSSCDETEAGVGSLWIYLCFIYTQRNPTPSSSFVSHLHTAADLPAAEPPPLQTHKHTDTLRAETWGEVVCQGQHLQGKNHWRFFFSIVVMVHWTAKPSG